VPTVVVTALEETEDNGHGRISEDGYDYHFSNWIDDNPVSYIRPAWNFVNVPVTSSPNIVPTPTNTPVATPTPTLEDVVLPAQTPVPMLLRSGDFSSFDGYACAYPWPRGCAYAVAVIYCESSFHEGADSNWPYVGWWQIDVQMHAGLIASLGYTVSDMYSGGPNTAVAWHLSSGGLNMSPWPYCQWQ